MKFWGQLKRFRGPIAAIAAFGAILSGLLGYWSAYQTVEKAIAPSPRDETAPPALSLAILPFASSSGSSALQQFADSLTQDLTTGIGQGRSIKVAAYGLVANYKSGAVDIRTLGRNLNVRYVVEGEVRPIGDGMVVAAHLIDTGTGTQAWSDRLQYNSLQPAPGQPVPSVQLTRRLRSAVFAAEQRWAVEHPDARNPMNLVLRGDALSADLNGLAEMPKARALYQEALRLNPNLVPALAGLAWTYTAELEESAHPDRSVLISESDRISSRAIALDPTSIDAWFARKDALMFLGRWDEALIAADRIIELDASNANGLLQRAWILIQTGKPAEAVPYIERAVAVDPLASWPYHFMCKAQLFMGHYDEAVAACERASGENNFWLQLVYLCAAYAQHGDSEKAAIAKAALLKQKPGYTVAQYRNAYQASPPAFFALVDRHLAAGLRKAGVPES
jgi:TolB-like protein